MSAKSYALLLFILALFTQGCAATIDKFGTTRKADLTAFSQEALALFGDIDYEFYRDTRVLNK